MPSGAWTWWRSRCCPGADGVLLGPGADELSNRTGLDLLGACEIAKATGKTGEVTSAAGPGRQPRQLRPGAGAARRCRRGAADRPAARRRRARAPHVRPSRRGHHDRRASTGPEGLEPFVVGTMLGSFGFHWRSGGPRQLPAAQVVDHRQPDRRGDRRRTCAGPSPSAAPAGAPGCSPRCRRTSRARTGWPTRPSRSPTRPGSRPRSGTSPSSPRRASAASSASAGPRPTRRA